MQLFQTQLTQQESNQLGDANQSYDEDQCQP